MTAVARLGALFLVCALTFTACDASPSGGWSGKDSSSASRLTAVHDDAKPDYCAAVGHLEAGVAAEEPDAALTEFEAAVALLDAAIEKTDGSGFTAKASVARLRALVSSARLAIISLRISDETDLQDARDQIVSTIARVEAC